MYSIHIVTKQCAWLRKLLFNLKCTISVMRQKTIPLDPSPNRALRFSKILIEVFVAILLIIWLHTSISKLLDFSGLKIQMFQSPVFRKIPTLAAVIGPSLEIIAALLLIFKRTRLAGFFLSFVLMLFFSWYVAYLMLTMPNLPCSCGGVVGWLNWPQHLTLNIFLTIISLTGFFLVRRQRNIEKPNRS